MLKTTPVYGAAAVIVPLTFWNPCVPALKLSTRVPTGAVPLNNWTVRRYRLPPGMPSDRLNSANVKSSPAEPLTVKAWVAALLVALPASPSEQWPLTKSEQSRPSADASKLAKAQPSGLPFASASNSKLGSLISGVPATPFPESPILAGESDRSLATVTAPANAEAATGANATCIVQEPPASSAPPASGHVPESPSAKPLPVLIEEMLTACVVLFVRVTGCAALSVPANWLPNASDDGSIFSPPDVPSVVTPLEPCSNAPMSFATPVGRRPPA